MADFDVRGSVHMEVADFIRDSGRVQSELRGIAEEAERTDRALRSLSSQRVVVDVEINGRRQLDLLWDQLEAMATTRYNIKVEVDVAEAVSRLLQLEALLVRVSTHPVNIDVDVNLAGAIANLSAFMATLSALNGATANVQVNVDRDMDSISRATAGAARGFSGLGLSMTGMLGPLAVLATAIIPVVSALAGLAAGVFGALSAVGFGIASFAAFAVPSIKKVTEGATALKKAQEDLAKATTADQIKKALADQKAILDGLSPLQQQAIKNLNDFKNAYSEMAKKLEPVTMRVFAEGLNFARAGLEGLFQVAGPAGDAIANVLKKASEGLKGDSWTKFFDYMEKNVGYFIETWLTGFGNIITAIGNLIVAFDPLSKDVSNGFLGMTERFLEWSKHLDTNKSFQNWMQQVKEDGPKVWETVKDIAGTLMDLTKALAPIGEKVLEMLGKFADFTNGLRESNPELYQMVVNFGAFALLLGPLLGPMTMLLGLFITLGPLVAGIAGGLLLLGAGLALAYTRSEEFREAVNKLVTEGLEMIQKKWREIKEDFEKIWPGIVKMWKIYGEDILTFVRETWESIKMIISGVFDTIVGLLKVFVGLFTGDWGLFWEGVKQTLHGAGEALAGIFKLAIDRLMLIVNLFGTWLETAFGDAWKKVSSTVSGWWDTIWTSTKNWTVDMGKSIGDFFTGLPGNAAEWMKSFGKAVLDGLIYCVTLVPGFGGLFKLAISGINLFDSGWNFLKNFWDGMKGVWEDLVNWFKDKMGDLTSWLPGSPAKKGPLSGKGWTFYRGRALIDNFRQGMEFASPNLVGAAGSIMQQVSLGGGLAPASMVAGVNVGNRFNNMGSNGSQVDNELLEKLANRPVIIQVDGQVLARTVETGNKTLERRR